MLFNLHAVDLFDELALLLHDLHKAKMPLWQQMHTLEILSVTIAEDLIANGTVFNLDPEEITWTNGVITRPPPMKRRVKGHGKRKTLTANMVCLVRWSMNMVPKVQVINLMLRHLWKLLPLMIIQRKHQSPLLVTLIFYWFKISKTYHNNATTACGLNIL